MRSELSRSNQRGARLFSLFIAAQLLSELLSGFLSAGHGTAEAAENRRRVLQVSGGIAAPARATAVHTNPAGLVGANTALVISAGAPEFWENGTYRAGLQTGGSSFGLAAGIENQDRATNDPLIGYYGLGVGTSAFSLGVGARTGITNADGTTVHAGLLFAAGANADIAVTARGIDDGVSEWGAGVAFKASSGVDLVLDAAADEDLENIEFKPGIRVSGDRAALTMSYATDARQQFADGFSAGASYAFTSGSVLELQYNAGGPLSKYFAALTVGF